MPVTSQAKRTAKSRPSFRAALQNSKTTSFIITRKPDKW